ncbi:MAG: hypothetical protein ACKOW9_03905, partial [Candidatus Paceibacterota bacterium]
YGTSTNFKAFSAGNLNLSGTGSSASFIGRYGFLYYPFVTDAVLTATSNGSSADLSWTASSAGLGWTVAGYNTGKASVSGGPYTYTNVGNVTSYSYTQLAPGEYCFVVQTYDNFGYVIATSDEDCLTISPVITFDLDTAVTDSETNPAYTVNLGTISVSDVKVSGTTDSVNMIIVEGSTNAPNGVVVQVKNSNGSSGLVSTSVPGDNINSSDGAMASGTENYGLCVMTATLSGFSRAAPYNSGSCATNSNTNDIQGLTTTGENILNSSTSPVYDAHSEIAVNAAISGATQAHSDYTDTLTFIATGTF